MTSDNSLFDIHMSDNQYLNETGAERLRSLFLWLGFWTRGRLNGGNRQGCSALALGRVAMLKLLCALMVFVSAARAGDLYSSGDAKREVAVVDAEWRDEARARDVPVRMYLPKAVGEEKFPLIVFSHGLGASREMYGYFGKHMAEAGYIVIAPTHHGSDTEALREWVKKNGFGKKNAEGEGWLQAGISDPDNLRNRPKDISFVIDRAGKEPKLAGIVDMERIGVAGHSFGAYTAMAIGGMAVDLPEAKGVSFRDPRVKDVLPMSPEGSGVMGIGKDSWSDFGSPVLFLTGTKDYGSGGRAASWRREAFDSVRGVDDYLFTIEGAGHMTFGGPGTSAAMGGGDGTDAAGDNTVRGKIRERIRDRVREKSAEKSGGLDPDIQQHVVMVESYSAAFFDAYVRGNEGAKRWLAEYAGQKHDDCTAEFKPGK